MPVNLTTLSKVFSVELNTKEQVSALMHALRVNIPKPRNAWEFLASNYGEKITDIFFARYTRKMWDLDLSDLPVSIVSRIPVKTDESRNYFNDNFQFMPRDGYASLFERMFSSPNIKFYPGEIFYKEMENEYDFVFNSMPIDEYFSYEFGELPYRSIKFEHRSGESFSHEVPTINFTDYSKYTRKTDWSLYPGCGGGHTSLITYEQPCDYKKNSYERYYPVKTTDGAPQKRYRRYAELAAKNKKVQFVGRCGQYIYYDMDQVVANSLKTARAFLKNQASEIAKNIS
jgi:UDP-galactopyranose mutase